MVCTKASVGINRKREEERTYELRPGQEAGEDEPQGQEESRHQPGCSCLILIRGAEKRVKTVDKEERVGQKSRRTRDRKARGIRGMSQVETLRSRRPVGVDPGACVRSLRKR